MVGTEDGTVRGLKGLAGDLEDQTAWTYAPRGRIVKKIAAPIARPGGRPVNRVAVAYWGGRVDILDGNGVLRSSRMFSQDVADMSWELGGTLVVALADGRLLGIKTQ